MEEGKKLIEQVFENEYDKANFKNLIANIAKKNIVDNNKKISLNKHEENFFESARFIDDFKTSDGKTIKVIEVKLKKTSGLVRPRYYQRDFVAKYITSEFAEGALVAFYTEEDSDWRFSFVKIDYYYKDGKEYYDKSSAVRYTYLVGENEPSHTAKKQLLTLLEKNAVTLDDILLSFSVEKVGKEFFEKYENLYKLLLKNLKNNQTFRKEAISNKLNPKNFAKKLMGRIVFLYFIQKKGWLGVPKNGNWGDGDKNFLYNLFLEITDKTENKKYLLKPEGFGNYYNDVLEHLFYDALNKQNLNSVSRDIHPYFNSKIPFLNGGLFESEYNWKETEIIIENDIFKEILETFNRYNFTVKEEDPLEKDIAVDPEMLGKVFENLLAQDERKKSGSFYTPRPIVYYMVKESLLNYLKQYLPDIPDIDLKTLMDGNIDGWETLPPDSIFDNVEKIDELLKEIKVVDPAVGSGAFIVSMLQEIAHMRILLSFYIDSEKGNNTEYKFKKYAIENSIYGVDIDSGAVDIAKLRLWLSLVVEHEIDEIEPLPNLDYKVICGNSLISEIIAGDIIISLNPPPSGLTIDKNLRSIIKEYEEKKHQYFNEYNEKEKSELKSQIKQLLNKYLLYRLEEKEKEFSDMMKSIKAKSAYIVSKKRGIELAKIVEQIESIKKISENVQKSISASFFPWKFEFSEVFEKGGFDIVIGNPPYIQLQKSFDEDRHYADLYENLNYKTFERTGDIYALFYEKGLNLLKENGILIYITSNKWMRANYGKSLRKFLSEYEPLELIDLGPNIFDSATVDTNILIVRKRKTKEKNLKALTLKTKDMISSLKEESFTKLTNLSEDSWIILSPEEQRIKEKIESIGTPLKDWNINIYYGIKTGYNEAFIIDGKTKEELIKKDPKSAEIIKPILRGRDIKRYKAEFVDKWLINTHNGYTNSKGKYILPVDVNKYSAIKQHLDKYWDKLKKRQDKGATPYNLRNCAYLEEFEKEKIVWTPVNGIYNFTLIKRGWYFNNSVFMITGREIKFLLAVLNSILTQNLTITLFTNLSQKGNYAYGSKISMLGIPIPKIPENKQLPFENLVDIIIEKKQKGEDTTKEEFQIDLMVYKLYDISYDEIKIIDAEIE
jgi:type I restriction-modification system DNA methylase subunit